MNCKGLKLNGFLMVAALLLAGSCAADAPKDEPVEARSRTINAIIGDESYVALTGRLPDEDKGVDGASIDEDDRIQIHLTHVERLLRHADTSSLSEQERAARQENLARLRAYIEARQFPRNDGHLDPRRPTFVDEQGKVCAVGHLMAEDLGREAVAALAPSIKYDFIEDIDASAFEAWADQSGLSQRELAMIQPSYGWGPIMPIQPDPIRDPRPIIRPKPIPVSPAAEINRAFATFRGKLGECLEKHVYPNGEYAEPWLPLSVTWGKEGVVRALDFELSRSPEALEGCLRKASGAMSIAAQGREITEFRLIKIPAPMTPKGDAAK